LEEIDKDIAKEKGALGKEDASAKKAERDAAAARRKAGPQVSQLQQIGGFLGTFQSAPELAMLDLNRKQERHLEAIKRTSPKWPAKPKSARQSRFRMSDQLKELAQIVLADQRRLDELALIVCRLVEGQEAHDDDSPRCSSHRAIRGDRMRPASPAARVLPTVGLG
jgi:hypothetical protein